MPKIVRMRKPEQHRPKEDSATPPVSGSGTEKVLPFPTEPEVDANTAARWIKLADQALGNPEEQKTEPQEAPDLKPEPDNNRIKEAVRHRNIKEA